MDYLKLNSIEYPFWFAVKAQREMAKENMAEKDDIYLIWLGLKYGAILEKKKFILTEDDLVDIFEVDFESLGKAEALLAEHLGKRKKMKKEAMKPLQ